MKNFAIVSTLISLIYSSAFACDPAGITGIMEENDLYIGPDDKGIRNLDETQFNKIIDELLAIYAPIITDLGKKLVVNRFWDDGMVNASTNQKGENWELNMYGGLARHPEVTLDGFALVLCHEIGHHLGGAPKKTSRTGLSTWISNEGQADYFANLKCFRKYVANDDNQKIVSSIKDISPIVTKKCRKNFSLPSDIAICQRSAYAGMSLAKLFSTTHSNGWPKFGTPDAKVVSSTDHSHPAAQCRLDTYFNASLCDKNYQENVSNRDPTIATCNRSQNYTEGYRPLCWYKPQDK